MAGTKTATLESNTNYAEATKQFSVVAYSRRQVSAMAGTKKTYSGINYKIWRNYKMVFSGAYIRSGYKCLLGFVIVSKLADGYKRRCCVANCFPGFLSLSSEQV